MQSHVFQLFCTIINDAPGEADAFYVQQTTVKCYKKIPVQNSLHYSHRGGFK